jgi:16S rRNA (guanine527-N7)-methyltransferase
MSGGSGGAEEQAPAHAADLFGPRLDLAVRYANLLATEGVRRGLIGPRESERMWDRHLLNCAVLGEVVPGDATVVDVGSGAGLPGIPLALARPDLRVTLLEPMDRRCRFLDEAIGVLDLGERVSVLRGRAPDVLRGAGGLRFDVAVARAVAPMERLGAMLLPVVRPGGVMLAMRGSRVMEELVDARGGLGAQGWHDVDVVMCGTGRLDEPTRVLRAVRAIRPEASGGKTRYGGGGRHDEQQGRRKAREPRRGGEAGRDQRARGQARST